MDPKHLLALAFQAAIFGTVFSFGLRTTRDDLLYLLRQPALLLRSMLAMLVIMPVVAIVLVKLFGLAAADTVALLALAISPVPPMLPKRQNKAGGLAPYGLSLIVTLGLASIVTIPLTAWVLDNFFSIPLQVAPAAIAHTVLVAIVLPLAAGMLVDTLLPRLAARLFKPILLIATVLLLLAALTALAATWRSIWSAEGGGTVLALLVFVVVGLAVGHVLGRNDDPEHASVLALSTACRHPGIAFAIAAASFPNEHFLGTILLYLLVNTAVCVPYIRWQSRQSAQEDGSANVV